MTELPPTDRPKLSVITGDRIEEVVTAEAQSKTVMDAAEHILLASQAYNAMVANLNVRFSMLKLAIDFSKYDHQMDTPEDKIIGIADKFYEYVTKGKEEAK